MSEKNNDLKLLFDNFIKTGEVTKEKEIVPGVKVKVKVLSAGDLLIAQTIMGHQNAPSDVTVKLRAASILSQSILSMNDVPIEREDYTSEDIRARRVLLYSQLLRMPGIVIQKMYELYIEAVNEQNSKYENFSDTIEEMENF